VSDFGLAILEDEATRGNIGTFRWMAPEVARREGASKSSDVYSFSMLMYELITHQVRPSSVSFFVLATLAPPRLAPYSHSKIVARFIP
jgi:serine/threonine protein kinase